MFFCPGFILTTNKLLFYDNIYFDAISKKYICGKTT